MFPISEVWNKFLNTDLGNVISKKPPLTPHSGLGGTGREILEYWDKRICECQIFEMNFLENLPRDG